MKRKTLQVAFAAVSFLLLATLYIIYSIHAGAHADALMAQDALIYDKKNAIETKKASVANAHKLLVLDTTGLDSARIDADTKKAAEFLDTVMNWENYAEYEAARQSCMDTYGISADNNFMKIFMPEVVTVQSKDGTEYNRIDTMGLNVAYEGLKAYVTNIQDDLYAYFTFVTWSSHDNIGNEAEHTDIFLYTIDGEGKIGNLDAYTVAEFISE